METTSLKIIGHVPENGHETSTTAFIEQSAPEESLIDPNKRSCVEKNGRNFVWGRLKNDLGIVGRVGCKENLLNNNYFSLIDSWPSGEIASIHLELGSLPTIKAKYIIKAGTFIGVGLFLKNNDHQIYVDNPEGVERISVPQKIST